jgi:hypothetical protein
MSMSAVTQGGTVPAYPPDPADHAQATLDLLEDFIEEKQQLKDAQLAVLNILEDATADRLKAEAAVKASISIMEDLSDAQAEIGALNAELEVRVDQRTAELVLANKNLEAFTYHVAHDLRSPLRALSGYSEALTEDYGDRLDDTGRWYADRIQAATEQMGTLIDDLLQLAQVSRTDMNLGLVDLSAEVTAISAELHDREPGRVVRFAIGDGVRDTADRSLIRTGRHHRVRHHRSRHHPSRHHRIRGHRSLLLRPGQRGRLRPRLRRQAVPAVPAAARGRRVPRHRHRPGQRPADHRTPRRPRLGRRRRRPRRHLLLHPERHAGTLKPRHLHDQPGSKNSSSYNLKLLLQNTL